MIETITASILAFASTNIDDIFILTLFYGSRKYSSAQIVTGQYLGIFFLVAVSLLMSLAGHFLDPRYIGLLGLFPVYLGLKQLWGLFRGNENSEPSIDLNPAKLGILAIAGVTVANGGDNVGIYVPLLSTFSTFAKLQLVTIFFMMVFLWCQLAQYLARHPLLSRTLGKYAHLVMPVVLLLLGVFIIAESRAYTLVSFLG